MKKSVLFALFGMFSLAGCVNDMDAPYDGADFAQGGQTAPLYNERTSAFMQADNQYSNINSYKPKTSRKKSKIPIVGILRGWKLAGKSIRV